MRTLQATPADLMVGAPRPNGDDEYLRPVVTNRAAERREQAARAVEQSRGVGRWRDFDGLTLEQWRAQNEPQPVCPYCGRVMSRREAAEQGACNDCHGDRR